MMSSGELKYCVYLTTYKGRRLPPFYIGSSSVAKVLSGYRGSVLSKEYSGTWKSELKENPNLFTTRIVSRHGTRGEAMEREAGLQIALGSAGSELYVNRAIASRGFMFTVKHTTESRQKIGEAQRGKAKSPLHRENIRAALRGRPKTDAQKAALATAWNSRDRVLPQEHKDKIASSLRGKPRSEETKKKIAAAWAAKRK
jgi:hypothetical protein